MRAAVRESKPEQLRAIAEVHDLFGATVDRWSVHASL
jgi:hypothetical protein